MARCRLLLLLLVTVVSTSLWLPSEALHVDKHGILEVGNSSTLDVVVPVGKKSSYRITHKYASYIAVQFADFALPSGDVIVISATDSFIKTTYSYTLQGRGGRSAFTASFVSGSEVRVEYFPSNWSTPSNQTAYRIVGYSWGLPSRAIESVCGNGDQALPALCYSNGTELSVGLPLAYEKSKAVARLLINGTWFCTGFLAGSEGHIFTNAHCFDYDEEVLTTDFEFGAESSSCSDQCEKQLGCPGVVVATHATLLVRDTTLDYALLKLPEGTDTSAYGYLQLRGTGPVKDEPIYVPQYPMGYAKRIVSYTDDNSSTTVKAVNSSDVCGEHQVEHNADTEQGASGSPVISDEDNAVVAIHHCGGCNNMAIDVRDVLADLKRRNITIRDLVASTTSSTTASGSSNEGVATDSIYQTDPESLGSDSGDSTTTQEVASSAEKVSKKVSKKVSRESAGNSPTTANKEPSSARPVDQTTTETTITTTPAPVITKGTPTSGVNEPTPTPAPTTVKPTKTPSSTPASTSVKATPAPTTVKAATTPTPTSTLAHTPTTSKTPTPAPTTVKPTSTPTSASTPTPTPTSAKATPSPTPTTTLTSKYTPAKQS